jgi:hypothetical protein
MAWQLATGAGAIIVPAFVMVFVLTHPDEDSVTAIAVRHFLIVGAVSALALAVALLLAVASVRSGEYRAELTALGFVVMGGLFAVHALATPGVILPTTVLSYGGPLATGSVLGVSAFLSISLPALLFAAGQTRLTRLLVKPMSKGPAAWLVAIVLIVVVAYGVRALTQSSRVAGLALNLPPASYVAAAASVALLLFAAVRQGRRYFASRLATDGSLVLAFLFLAEAQVAMVLSQPYHFVWWEYHALMLAGVQQAFKSLWESRGTELESIARSRQLRELEEALVSNPTLARHAAEHGLEAYREWFDVAFDQAVSGLPLDDRARETLRARMMAHVHGNQRLAGGDGTPPESERLSL